MLGLYGLRSLFNKLDINTLGYSFFYLTAGSNSDSTEPGENGDTILALNKPLSNEAATVCD